MGKQTTDNAGTPSVESLVERGYLFLEDSDWNKADEYFDKALDINPKNAPAYIGKLCVELMVCQEESLGDYQKLRQSKKFDKPLGEYAHFQKALRFADDGYLKKLNGYDQKIKESFPKTIPQQFTDEFIKGEIARLEKEIADCDTQIVGYEGLVNMLQNTAREKGNNKERTADMLPKSSKMYEEQEEEYYKKAKDARNRVEEYKDKKAECEAIKQVFEPLADISCLDRMDYCYNSLVEAIQEESTEDEYKDFAKQFRLLEGYKDSAELADKCDKLAKKIRHERLVQAEREKEREKKARYDSMVQEKNNASSEGRFNQLATEFREMGNYENAAQLADECDKLANECGKREKKTCYDNLVKEKDNASSEKKYKHIAQKFREMGNYENAVQLADECDKLAVKTRYDALVQEKPYASSEEKYEQLAQKFREMGDYENAAQLADECDKQILVLEEQREKQERIRESKEKIKKAFPTIGLLLQFGMLFVYLCLLWGTNLIYSIKESVFWNIMLPAMLSLVLGIINLLFRKDTRPKFLKLPWGTVPWGTAFLIFGLAVTTITANVWMRGSVAGGVISVILALIPVTIVYFMWADSYSSIGSNIGFTLLAVVLTAIAGGIISSISDNPCIFIFIMLVIPAIPGMIIMHKTEGANW